MFVRLNYAILLRFENCQSQYSFSPLKMPEQWKLEKWMIFLQNSKKVVFIVLYGPTISPSDCKKASPYHLPHNRERKQDEAVKKTRRSTGKFPFKWNRG